MVSPTFSAADKYNTVYKKKQRKNVKKWRNTNSATERSSKAFFLEIFVFFDEQRILLHIGNT